jgi:hypothetical protein
MRKSGFQLLDERANGGREPKIALLSADRASCCHVTEEWV